MASTSQPKRVMSPEQREAMLAREKIVLEERIRGKSFYRIGQEHGIHNPDRVFKRALARDENASFRRAEAIRLEEMRLDELQDGIWDRAIGGDSRAVEVALKVLERRAKMHGLDFADMVSGQLVEVERAKVKVMASALVAALNAVDLPPEQSRAITAAFFEQVRQIQTDDVVQGAVVLTDEDRNLL